MKELKDKNVLISVKYSKRERANPPFSYVIRVKASNYFPKKYYCAMHMGIGKKQVIKAIVSVKLCDQIFLPHHMKDQQYPINLIKSNWFI